MFSNLKQNLRRRVFGRRFQQQLIDDNKTISRLGNYHYLTYCPELTVSGHQPSLNAYEFSYYSQNGEDGIILYLLSRIGAKSHFIVEIGTEDGRECNSSNLILNYGWRACLIEAKRDWSDKAKLFFAGHNAGDRVQCLNSAATPENINNLLSGAGVPEDIDILSIDIDSFDYWLWEAIEVVQPRLVVIEYNASFGPERSITIPPANKMPSQTNNSCYHGASIKALQRLGQRKGYELAGCDSKGVNAFFVRNDLITDTGIKIVTVEQAYYPHFWRTRSMTVEEQIQSIEHLPLVEIQ